MVIYLFIFFSEKKKIYAQSSLKYFIPNTKWYQTEPFLLQQKK